MPKICQLSMSDVFSLQFTNLWPPNKDSTDQPLLCLVNNVKITSHDAVSDVRYTKALTKHFFYNSFMLLYAALQRKINQYKKIPQN